MRKMANDKTGNNNKPCRTPIGFEPDNQPITGELIIRPLNPHVTVNPIAVADWFLKSFPTIAIVVGNTGAMATPVMNTVAPVIH